MKFRFFIKDIVIAFLNLRRIDVFLFIGIKAKLRKII